MKKYIILVLTILALNAGCSPKKYIPENVVWNSPSVNSMGSMPLGNGDIGLNVWALKDGTVSFYIAKTDAWEENGRLLKIGKVNIRFNPNPFSDTTNFRQVLNLNDGAVEIAAGKGKQAVNLKIWVDACNPVIHFDAEVSEKTEITAKAEIWRNKADTMKVLEASDLNYFPEIYGPTVIQPDIIADIPGKIAWYHHNPETPGFAINMKAQGLDGFGMANPLKNRIFGALIEGKNFEKTDNTTLVNKSGKRINLLISVLTQHPSTPEKWLNEVKQVSDRTLSADSEKQYAAHKKWWHGFWDRSWIEVTGGDTLTTTAGVENTGDVLSRGYRLQRFITACGSRGNFPVKFNGSLFTVDYNGKEGFGDYRRWGTGYWWQNTRLPVLGMPAAGDFDMMHPLFNMYFSHLQLAKYRTKMAFNHSGAYFPECVYFWGSVFTHTWGNKNIDAMADPIQESGWHKYEWVCGPELVSMMYDYFLYTGDSTFAKEKLIPLTVEVIRFFMQHYKTDETGRLRFEPSQSLETWWKCTNALPEVAGVRYTLKIIDSMPKNLVDDTLKSLAQKMEKLVPDIPLREVAGKTMLAPARVFEIHNNVENPELYAVFPFRLYGLNHERLEQAVNAYHERSPKGNFGWRQDDLWAALLGLTNEAKTGITERARNWDKSQRFPAFWGPNYDWTPDQDHGGVLMKTTQSMVMQCDGKQIRLLPAWPREWNVSFKLHAPYNTTVECVYMNGKIEKLRVAPESRKKDVVYVQ